MDTEPDEMIITPQGAVQRWDTAEGMRFRLDVWNDRETKTHDREEKSHDGTTESTSGNPPGDDGERRDALEGDG